MPIKPEDISTDEDLARRVLALARTIAPCVVTLSDESDEKKTAIAILKSVADDIESDRASRGSRRVVSQGVLTARVSYDIGSAFTDDDRDSLRALCNASASPVALPVGSFPKGRPIGALWPEEY